MERSRTFKTGTWRAGLWLVMTGLAALVVFIFAAAGGAGSSPTITSDQSDYTPGATVTLTGTGWAADETVHIVVNDTIGQSWQHVVDVTSSEGTIVDRFTLPTYFVSDYDVTATGPVSGTATTTFTDSTLPSSVQLRNWETKPSGGWVTATLGTSNSDYKEGETVPYQLDLGNLGSAGNPWYAPVCRDYANTSTGPYGYTQLQPFDTSRAADSGGVISSTSGAFSGVGITITGVEDLGASSGSVLGSGTYSCGSTQRLVIVRFDVTGTGTKYLLWGGRLSMAGDTSPTVVYGKSSSFYPGGSLQMRLASPDKTGGINPGAIIQLAKLTVTKVVDSGTATPDQWSFHVTGPNGYDRTQSPASGSSSVDFVSLDSGTYTVTESSLSGYTFVSGSGTNCTFNGSTATCTVTAAAGGATNASATFHNAQDVGSLKISKVFDPSTSGFSGTFTIHYNCGTDKTVELAAGADTTITGIPVGTECTVSEPTLPTAPTGWTFGTPAISPTQPVTIDSTTTPVAVTVTNSISRDEGYLKITKSFDPKTSGFSGKFDVAYNCGGGDQTVQLGAGDSTTVGPFATGTECTVTEPATPTAPTGYVFGTPTFTDSSGTVNDGVVTITKGTTATAVSVTVNNSIKRTVGDSGTLKLVKTLSGGPSDYHGPFTIGYECKSGDTTVVSGTKDVTAGSFETVSVPFYDTTTGAYLLPVTCTVSETPPTPPAGYSFGTPAFDPSSEVTLTAATPDGLVTVTTANTLTHDQGYLKLSKVFDAKTSGFDGKFTIHYNCGSDETVELAAGGSTTVGPFDTGTECTVSEPALPTAPVGWTFGDPQVSGSPATIVKGGEAAAVEVTVTNSITRDQGYLKISKVFAPLTSGFTGTFTVKYDCDGTANDGSVELAAGGSETIGPIDTGTVCTISEPDLPKAPDGWTFGTPDVSGSPVTIVKGDKAAASIVTVTNSITRDQGYLKLTKSFDANGSGFDGTFAVVYNCGAGDQTVDLAAGASTTVGPFDTGTSCTVSEPTLPKVPENWTFGTPSVSKSPVIITKGDAAAAVEVTVTNTITRDQGYLKITKVFDPKTSGFTGTFTVKYNCGSDKTVELAAGGSTTVGPFDTGTECTVSEPDLPTAPAGYVFGEPKVTGSPAEIVKGDQAAAVEVTVTNTISRTASDGGTLKLAKTLTGGPSDYAGPFTIGYECKSGTTVVTSGTKSVAAGDFATVDVPFYTVGGVFLLPITCKVTETPPAAPTDYSFGTPTFDPSNEVTFTVVEPQALITVTTQNTLIHDQGYLKIKKVFDAKTSGFSGSFTIHWSCGGDSGDVTLAAGETSAAIGPYDTGTQCTVTEPTLPSPPATWVFGSPSISPAQPVTIVKSTDATAKLVTVTNSIMQSGLVTNSSLCTLPNDQFRLVYTPDQTAGWKLNASNPGQYYYNAFYSGPGDIDVTITLPYPFVTQGAVPIHVYSDVGFSTAGGVTCLTPSGELANSSTPVTLGNYTPPAFGSETTVKAHIPALSGGFAYINIHLDYGLKGTTGYAKGGPSGNDAVAFGTSTVLIPDKITYGFTHTGAGKTYSVTSINVFKKDPGIGGLVLRAGSGDPVVNAKVQVTQGKTTLATVYTDEDGWYMWQYKWTGKAADLTVKMTPPGSSATQTQTVALKANGYVVVSFTVP